MFSRPGVALRHAQQRGMVRLLVLKVLSSRPMHGYEIGKEISALFKETYRPSPGVIYPTLQRLEDQGLVAGSREEGKTIYRITTAGKNLLARRTDILDSISRLAAGSTRDEDFPLRRSASRLERTIMVYLSEMSTEKRIETAKILDEATEKISRLMRN